ncbi:hypothetical protein [Thaumasiovibrio sp. DFM-14]|uniref:hypothetical protein n=1 Tax=Thaumasiovibrio sp. DFM-14 TaxID=3384792 RepID=UPI0039A200B7
MVALANILLSLAVNHRPLHFTFLWITAAPLSFRHLVERQSTYQVGGYSGLGKNGVGVKADQYLPFAW